MDDSLINDLKRLRVLTQSDNSNMDDPSIDASCQNECLNKTGKYSNIPRKKDKPPLSKCLHTESKYNSHIQFNETDDSRSSIEDPVQYLILECGSRTDSDDIKGTWNKNHLPWRPSTAAVVESDSLNENFRPSRESRRKRKFKRMSVDSHTKKDISESIPNMLEKSKWSPFKRSELRRNQGQNSLKDDAKNFPPHRALDMKIFWKKDKATPERFCGKRKRSIRDKGTETRSSHGKDFVDPSKLLSSLKFSDSPSMELDGITSTSPNTQHEPSSSSESECGILTNDEGREGDDEQSDCFYESYSPPRMKIHLRDKANQNNIYQRYDHNIPCEQRLSQFEPNASAPWKKREIMCGKRRITKYRPNTCQSVKEESLNNDLMQYEVSRCEKMEGDSFIKSAESSTSYQSPLFGMYGGSAPCPVPVPDQGFNRSADFVPRISPQQKLTRKRLCSASYMLHSNLK